MAAKTQRIFELLQDTAKSLSDYKNWTSFLKSASWQYKYPFEDQVLIYAQRPDAIACARIEIWNNNMHRCINKGAKGIALLRENGNRYGLEYVFDVSDTNDRYNRDVRLWQYDERYDDAIIETLSNTFGDLKVDVTIQDAIICAAHNAVADNKADYLHELGFVKGSSFLSGLDDVNLDLRFRQTAEVSVAYMIMQRMGLEPDDLFSEYEFEHIRDFNTPETMNILGNAVSSISETALRNISETIRAEQRKFAQQRNNIYNRSEKSIDSVNKERTEENGRDSIQNERVLSDTRPDSTNKGTQDRQIRYDAQNISEAAPPEPVLNASDEGRAAGASGGYRQDSDRTGTESRGADGESRGRDGDNESERSAQMDGLNEQLSPFSRGERTQRAGVQLSLFDVPLPREEEQKRIIDEAEHTKRSAFSMPQQIIDEVLTTGGNDRDSVLKICVQYSKNKSAEDNISFLKKEYGTGGKGFQFDNSKVSVWWNEDGMRIAYGDRAIGRGEFITWDRVDKRIGELLAVGRFTPQETLDRLDEFERRTAATHFYEMYRDADSDDYPDLKEFFDTEWFVGSYSDTIDNVADLFKQSENVNAAIAAADALNSLYVDDEDVMRFRWYSPDKVLPVLKDLQLEHKTFVSDKTTQTAPTFITEDEIDKLFTRGSGFDRSKIRIYLYFKEHTNTKERIDFLKNEYATGGYGGGIFNESHDAKGITFSRSDIFSPFAKVTLSWNKAEKRIDSLIKSGRYLTEREINEDIPRYQSEQEQRRIEHEKYMYLHDMDNLSASEKRETLPKRIQYFTDIMENYEKEFFEEYGIEHLLGKTEIVIGEAIRDNETRRKLSECMNKIGSSATDVLSRNCGYKFAEELNELKVIELHKVGDFYEMYGDEAVEAAKVLETTLTRKQLDGEYVAMTGITAFAVERYARLLDENGYVINFPQKEYDLGFGKLGNGTTVWNKLEEENHDYKTVAHISDSGEVKYYEDLPDDVKQLIEEQAAIDKTEYEERSSRDTDIIGKELTIDDRKFVVERVGEISGGVTLRDVTFENSVGFPISRVEKIDTVRRILEEQEQKQENLIPNIEKPKPAPNTVIYPEIPMSERHNFRITDDNLGHGTPTQKYERNIEAIKTLKKLEDEHRLAVTEEQEILSQYVGWGGLADCFDERNSHYTELKSLLTEDEYSAARESTLTAFYTPPVVIRSVYKALENMGLKQGNILDPAMGVGNFEGMLPDSLSDCKMYGIELDSISGRIAQQLYQKNAVTVQEYEDTTLPDSFFDAAVGNVPFGDFKVPDKKYNKHKFLIHDYFFAKTLDKVRPGGVVAFITSSGTMDKKNSNVRKYIAQRADLIGAIRLPDNTFKANAGTEVTSDILFLQKRDRMTDIMPEWINLGTDENGHTINQYFIDNPDMILGDMVEESGPFGMQLNCKAYEGADLNELLNDAIQNIHAQITEYEFEDISNDEDLSIPADPNVKNFSYTIVDGDIYFRENSRMNKVDVSLTAQNRIKGMIEIRDCVKELIEYQTEDYPDSEIKEQQAKLNRLYDNFTAKYGLINSRGNNMAFSSDSSYFLLCSLEILNDNGELERKADMFTKRTIGAKKEITHVDTASEALAVSLGEKARIDMDFMSQLMGKTEQELFEELKGVIFLNPLYDGTGVTQEKYLTADEYLSGNVREKLEWAKRSAELYPDDYTVNVEALTAVQPKDLTAAEITVRLGTTWIPPEYIKEFTFELLTPSYSARRNIDVHYSKLTGNWNISGKSSDRGNVKINSTYGTHRINALKIIEDTLNLRDVRIFDYKENEKGNRVPVLNAKETTIAQQKQEAIKAAFDDWIWKNPERREHLTRIYNEKFNSFRTREYDGSHITFSGMNPEIQLRQHQKNAVARIMYGGNSLLGHVVGAGKTWTMAASAMESKRLGLCNKPLFVVPNHLTEQWASEFLQLYPAANILVTTKKDFETKNRKKFCGRIATGDYDAIIMGHSQFEKIPMSSERQEAILWQQLHEILDGIAEAKSNNAERFTIKQMERTKKSIEAKIKKLNDTSRKDDVVTFEELGVDRMFVDEAHNYKNLFLVSKMRNVGGIAQTDAQKSSDMFMKCRYLDELTGGKGNIFATGTPISNSMVELYTMQRYLQYDTLAKNDLQHFDAWASTFGETVTAIELAPEGTGYRAKTRFAKFYNIPELMTMFREVADIQTADMLKLPVPEAEYHNIAVEPTEIQREMVAELGNRAETVRSGGVDPTVDNMLKITNDGRKLALDQRLMNDMLPDEKGTKVAACADNVFDIWQKTSDFKGTQLVFCDSSTPKKDGTFNVYDDIHNKLISKGVPENDIAFIHDADSDVKKKELFAKVRRGDVRILLGSTQKMGAGTNVQTRLYASHDLDCPWRPSDLEQRAGRIIRQGNTNDTVHIYRYVTKDTFDSYSYQLVENKQKFISQIMTSKSPVRSAEDIDETALSYAEIKALATGNPNIKEKMELDTEVAKLKLLKASFMSQKYELEDKVIKYYPQEIKKLTEMIAGAEKDIVTVEQHPKQEDKFCPMTINGLGYYEKEKAGNALIERCKAMTSTDPVVIGEYRGFTMILSIDTFANEHKMTLQGSRSYTFPLGADVFGNIQRIDNALGSIEKLKSECEEKLTETKNQFEIAKMESKKEFPKEAELAEKTQRLAALDALLNMDKREPQAIDMIPDEDDMPRKKNREMER